MERIAYSSFWSSFSSEQLFSGDHNVKYQMFQVIAFYDH